jgi:hypothetical protein
MSNRQQQRAVQSQVGADILLRLYSRITGEPLDDIDHPSQLSGRVLLRETLDSVDYDDLTDLVHELKNVYSASGMRCLRSDAEKHKTPVLNLIRQVAKANGLSLTSNRKSAGYSTDGRKRFTYWYIFEALDGDFIPSVSEGAGSTISYQRPIIEHEPISGTLILPNA